REGERWRSRVLRPRGRLRLRSDRRLAPPRGRTHLALERVAGTSAHRPDRAIGGGQVMTELDAKLEHAVEAELYRDPRVDSAAIAVHDAAVTLRGPVGSLGAKGGAGRAAGRAGGARSVHNELEVRLLTEHRRDDAELRARALEVLSWNASVPDEVDAAVKEGV